ncbi:MAG: GAF domain-containing protein, partial [Candidatus Omnitrophica bacterium]|nr:GAF domain-containing protein [Candidatus Omnitrophota bacterium]
IGYSGIIFIPISFYHFTMTYLQEIRERMLILVSYFIGVGFLITVWTTKLFISGYRIYFWGFYPKASYLHPFYLLLLFFLAIRGLKILAIRAKQVKKLSPVKYVQIKYLFLAFIIYCLASSDFLVNYGIEFYPLGFIPISFSLGLVTYAIVKHHLLDIKITLTRLGIFIFVYFFVLSIPFWIGYKTKSWFFSTALAVILSTLGIFIYNKLRKEAEDLLRKEERKYQHALREAAKEMARIKDLDKLIKAIVLTVIEQVKVSFACVYLKEEEYKSYHLKYLFPLKEKSCFPEFIPSKDPLVEQLNQSRRPLTSEELVSQDKLQLNSGLVIPCFIADSLLGFMIIGAKPNNQAYTSDDLIIFETLSYSVSLAIENCLFWKEFDQQQRRQRLSDLDLFSYSLAHEIDNPLTAIKTATLYLRDYLLKDLNLTEEQNKEMLSTLNSILKEQERISSMIRAIEEFGKKTAGEFSLINLEDLLKSYLELYLAQFKYHGIVFTQELPSFLPYIRGAKQELLQVLVNLSNNSIHALLGR